MAATSLRVIWILVLCSSLVLGGQAARTRHYKWSIDYQFRSPDCVEKTVIAINGQYPGPTIRANAGDTVVVELENLMPTEAVALHWHGIRQIGTPWFDGTPSVCQCPILPGETFTYKFVVDKAGTYFYHGHYGLQRSEGLYGSLIVDPAPGAKEPFEYHAELSIVLNDWWHKPAYQQGLGLFSKPFRWVGEPQSLLINGRGQYNCSLLPPTASTCNVSNPECLPQVLPVEKDKTYRIRIASAASLSSLNLIIEGHKMTVVEVDGNYVEPVEVDNLDVYSGETYSVLVKANRDPTRNYWVAVNVRGRLPKTPPGLAVLNYVNNKEGALLPATKPPVSPVWNDYAYSLAQSQAYVAKKGFELGVPVKADRRIVLLNTQNLVDGVIKWALNNISLAHPSTPYLPAMKYGIRDTFSTAPPPYSYAANHNTFTPPVNPAATASSGVYMLPFNSTVDVVLQNANTLTPNNSEVHPWHLHGHDFWVLGYGLGKFEPRKHEKTYNLRNPPLRNTVPVFPYGWTTLRFRADNPGVWPFHCHVEPHFHMGMGVIFAEGIKKVGPIPRSTMGCGLTKNFIRP